MLNWAKPVQSKKIKNTIICNKTKLSSATFFQKQNLSFSKPFFSMQKEVFFTTPKRNTRSDNFAVSGEIALDYKPKIFVNYIVLQG